MNFFNYKQILKRNKYHRSHTYPNSSEENGTEMVSALVSCASLNPNNGLSKPVSEVSHYTMLKAIHLELDHLLYAQ